MLSFKDFLTQLYEVEAPDTSDLDTDVGSDAGGGKGGDGGGDSDSDSDPIEDFKKERKEQREKEEKERKNFLDKKRGSIEKVLDKIDDIPKDLMDLIRDAFDKDDKTLYRNIKQKIQYLQSLRSDEEFTQKTTPIIKIIDDLDTTYENEQ
jgi:hypothetical protein